MHDLSNFFAVQPFAWNSAEKFTTLLTVLQSLTHHHQTNCPEYLRLSTMLSHNQQYTNIEDLPYLPVRLFKIYALLSINKKSIFKTLTSSGTSGQAVSKIYLDQYTSQIQTKALTHISKDFIGGKRLPMVILDCKSVLKNPLSFSARGAGIMGFSTFGYDHFYAFNDNMELDRAGLLAFVDKHQSATVLFFGFTFMIWQYFCNVFTSSQLPLGLTNAIVIHGGGWKKLIEQAVTNDRFKNRLKEICGTNTRVHNFYGMVEQTGSIYMECENGHLHSSNFSHIVIRDPISLQQLPIGKIGLIETISVLPWSYPGHILLTEDLGEWLGEDDCSCGRKGRYFMVHGRVPQAEARGCSDTYVTR